MPFKFLFLLFGEFELHALTFSINNTFNLFGTEGVEMKCGPQSGQTGRLDKITLQKLIMFNFLLLYVNYY